MNLQITCLILINFLISSNYGASLDKDPIITLKQGQLKGKIGLTRAGKEFYEFSIPYAKKPINFQLAEPIEKWTGVFDGSKAGLKCLQIDSKTKEVVGSEDCLYLQIFTKELPKKEINGKLKPVIVFIHGGSFLARSGDEYKPNYILDEDVIFVNLNYRLGALGFLNSGTKEITANLGLKDQILALKFLHENLASFIGDKDKITLLGVSSGSSLVSYHLISPLSKGLFKNAISQSGTALCPWSFVKDGKLAFNKLADVLGCKEGKKSTSEMAECVKRKDGKEIISKQIKLLGLVQDPPVPFAPSVETGVPLNENALPSEPQRLFEEAKFNENVNWILGVNSMDGLNPSVAGILNNTKQLEVINKNWDKYIPSIFGFGNDDKISKKDEIAQKIKEFYFKGKDWNYETRENAFRALTDRNFFQCTKKSALYFAKSNPTYIYYFDYRGGAHFLDHFGYENNLGIKEIGHASEQQYLFPLPTFPEIKRGDKNLEFSQNFVKLWTYFATEGKINPSNHWPAISKDESSGKSILKWYKIDKTPLLIEEPFKERLEFWDKNTPISNSNSMSNSSPAPALSQPASINSQSHSQSLINKGSGGNEAKPFVIGHDMPNMPHSVLSPIAMQNSPSSSTTTTTPQPLLSSMQTQSPSSSSSSSTVTQSSDTATSSTSSTTTKKGLLSKIFGKSN